MTALPVAPSKPQGWDELTALGPVTDRTDARCWACGAPAIAATLRHWVCSAHPPQPGEWGHALNWAPLEGRSCAPNRCYCARCPSFQLVGHHASDSDFTSHHAVVDDLAARRAAHTFREGP